MIANQLKIRNARNANMLISDVQLKKDHQQQMVTEALREREDYNKILQQMKHEDLDNTQKKRLQKMERQRQLRECYENQIKTRDTEKVKERESGEKIAQVYNKYIETHDKHRADFMPKAIHSRPGVPAPTGGRKEHQYQDTYLTGLDVGIVKDISRKDRYAISSEYHKTLDEQVTQRKEAMFLKRQREDQATQDAIDMQMSLQHDFTQQRKVIDNDRKVLYDSYLRQQVKSYPFDKKKFLTIDRYKETGWL
jgi:hypothetical protein